MTVKDIYDSALRFIGESTVDGDNDDYEERAPYIVAAFCAEVEATDRAIRKLHGKNEENSFSQVYLAFDNEFPLLEIFYTPAALYLAAMLVIDLTQNSTTSFLNDTAIAYLRLWQVSVAYRKKYGTHILTIDRVKRGSPFGLPR